MNRRAGFTLVELMVVTVLGSVVMLAVYHTMVIQQRSYRHQRGVIATQQNTRLALATIASELREVSPPSADLLVAAPGSISFRAYRKLGFVCTTDAPGKKFELWPIGQHFVGGDSLMVFADGDPNTSKDDQWRVMEVGSVGSASSCTTDWEGQQPIRLNMPNDSAKLADIRSGATVRSFEHQTYGHYQIDGDWVLGRHGVDDSPVALLGPLADPERYGLRFAYFDTLGTPFIPGDSAGRAAIRRVRIAVRALAPPEVAGSTGEYEDSLSTELYFRNR